MDSAAGTPPFGIATAAALLCGVTAILLWPGMPPGQPVCLLVVLAGGVMWWKASRWRWVGALLVGLGLSGLHAGHTLALQLPAAWERRVVTVSGTVDDLPEHEPRQTRFLFKVDDDRSQPEPLRGHRLRVSWSDADASTRGSVQAGQRWRFKVRLKAPRGLRNAGGSDAEKHAFASRIAANAQVRQPHTAQRLVEARGLQAWREGVSARIAAAIPGDTSRFIQALAIGDTRAIRDEDWTLLRANGLTHLIAISGSHVGLVSTFFAMLVYGLWWLLPGLSGWAPRQVAAAAAAMLGALAYSAAAGFAVPTVRTALMIAAVSLALGARRRVSPFDTLALAVIVVLLYDPLSVLGAGFWLSFMGVAWLMWCLPQGGPQPVREFLSAQGVATVGLLPMAVLLFGQVSMAGPVANLVAVPWWSLVVVPLSLLGAALESLHAGLGAWPLRAAAWCFDLSWPLFEWLGSSPLALWWVAESRWFALPLALLGAFWLLLPRGVAGKSLAALLWLPLLWPDRQLPTHGVAEVTVIDVGQGLSVLVRTAGHTLLYDTGPAMRDGFDAGERAVLPTLRARGVRRIDRVVVSHADNDHAGGLDAVRAAYALPALLAPEGAGIDGAGNCMAGEGWAWDGVRFRFLHPTPYFPYLANDSSCVLRVETRQGVLLLTGDIGEIIERELVRREPAALLADVVVVAHHGSETSSDPAFVKATRARHAIMSTGHGNLFRHPRPSIVQRWRDAGATVWDTAKAGAITFRLGQGTLAPETRRSTHRRLWDAAQRVEQGRAGLSYRLD
ncbi:transporter [Lysobacter daejeonensis GH1-9]|uniref:Transporter n=1 Tax=Lysobacter daejeonensis GH1-9 TaxID=1385517 RepID=A0A0A0EZE8_9GAMM|nr:DNA internalization-related competence protein ComEC/Rec2 [Lysobacter daejeonensis]KGM55894.1 transporter [Lysobacter daejeonensis GH1-9]